MKLLKLITVGMLAATVFSVTTASAVTTIVRITGSTAYRGALYEAILDTCNITTVAYTGSTFSKAACANVVGTMKTGGYAVEFQTSFAGSVSGIQTVAQAVAPTGINPGFLAVSNTGSAPSITGSAGFYVLTGGLTSQATGTNKFVPNIAMADVFQGTTPYNSTATGVYNAASLTDNVVGVVPFVWVAGSETPTAQNLNNMTTDYAITLYEAGFNLYSLLSGSLSGAHTSTYFYAVGRDADSGTRMTALADTTIGVSANVNQYAPLNDSSFNPVLNADGSSPNIVGLNTSGGVLVSGTILSTGLFPAESLNGISYTTGNTGYSSGGQLATAMQLTGATANLGGTLIAYLGLSDAATAITSPSTAFIMSYNGVTESVATVESGRYAFWGFEHLDYLPSFYTSGATETTGGHIADALVNDITTVSAPQSSGILIGNMQVSRSSDGQDITTGAPSF